MRNKQWSDMYKWEKVKRERERMQSESKGRKKEKIERKQFMKVEKESGWKKVVTKQREKIVIENK